METAKKAFTWSGAWTGRKAYGLSGLVFQSQSHLNLRAQPKNWRWEMPKPPKFGSVMWGRTYSRKRRARDVRCAAERQSSTGAAVTTAGARVGLDLGSG